MENEFNWDIVEDFPSGYILLENDLFKFWGGGVGTFAGGKLSEVENFIGSDADRALSLDEPVGQLDVGGGKALVALAGQSAAWIPLESGGGCIVLEVDVVSEGDTVSPEEVLMQVPPDKWHKTDLLFSVTKSDLILCSVNEYSDHPIAMGSANVALRPGIYGISHASFFFDDEPYLIFVRLIPLKA